MMHTEADLPGSVLEHGYSNDILTAEDYGIIIGLSQKFPFINASSAGTLWETPGIGCSKTEVKNINSRVCGS